MTAEARPGLLPGGWLLLSPGDAHQLAFLARAGVAALYRRDGIAAAAHVRVLVEVLGEASRAALSSASGSAEVPPEPVLPSSVVVDPVTTRTAAGLLGCSPRNVRDLCARGAFESAVLVEGRWLVERGEVEARRIA